MAHAGNILVASTQAAALEQMIKTKFNGLRLPVELCHAASDLMMQLTARGYTLLLVDLEFLPPASEAASFWIKLKTVAPETSVVVLAPPEARGQAVAHLPQGAVDYLLWPVEAEELAFKIGRLLEIYALKIAAQESDRLASTTDKLLLLHQTTQAISQTWQVDEALRIVLSKVQQLTGAKISLIFPADRSGRLDKQQHIIGSLNASSGHAWQNFWLEWAEQAALTQSIIRRLKPAAGEWPDPTIEIALFTSIFSRDKLIGVLALGHAEPAGFVASDIQWLSVFCDQVAIALENSHLFENLATAYIDLAQSRERILHSRNTLQALFDGISDSLIILDQDLTIIALNQVEAERQGYQPDELVGKSSLTLDWATSAPELLERVKESLSTGRETMWISPENETEPYLKDREFRIYPIRNRIGPIEQVIILGQDVSERRRWQASLFRSANLAAVGQLAGSVAHQINNPLTITMANSQLLLYEVDPSSEAYDLASGILKAGTRIQNIVENLLGFSNQGTYLFVEIDLIETLEGALALVARSLQKDRVELVKDYRAQPKLVASMSHLKLVWMNLILNARDAVVGYTQQPQITLSTEMVSTRQVKVAVTDNGMGIPEKNFEQLFRPFFTTKPVGKALGLGLYSAQAIVERHQGQIAVFSQPGLTTFEVTLPLDNPRDL
ncbi:MAG: ATP-binding protein [Anaerolineae bacterium]